MSFWHKIIYLFAGVKQSQKEIRLRCEGSAVKCRKCISYSTETGSVWRWVGKL